MRSEAEIREAIEIVSMHLQHIEVPESVATMCGALAALRWMMDETEVGLSSLIANTKAFLRAQRQ